MDLFETQQPDSINSKQLMQKVIGWLKYILRRWLIIGAALIIGGLVGLFIATRSPVTYSSKLSFVLEEGKASGGGLSALAGQFGFDFGSSGSSSLLSGENIIGLLKSKRFTEQVLLTPYTEGNYSLADKYADVYKWRKKWEKHKDIKAAIFFPANKPRNTFTRLQDSLLQIIEGKILAEELFVTRPDKKMSFFNVGLTSRDEMLSKVFTERLVNNVVNFYIEAKTRRLRSNVDRLQYRADSIAALLNNKTYAAAAAQSRSLDVNPAYQTAGVNAEVSTRNKVMIGTIYGEIVKNLEIQKVALSQETPVIQMVDEIQLPLQKNKTSKLIYVLTGAILGAFLCIGFLLARKYILTIT